MEETKTHTCYIEVDGNVITRDANGTLIQEFTGNWSVLHKVYRFATMTAAEKQKHKRLSPNLYIGSIKYVMRHRVLTIVLLLLLLKLRRFYLSLLMSIKLALVD